MPDLPEPVRKFLMPDLTKVFAIRLCVVVVGSYVLFGHVILPARAAGISMEPTYKNGQFLFCSRLRYWRKAPQVGDVVMVRLSGRKVMYLKRVVAKSGNTVAFVDGKLVVNGNQIDEPYVSGSCDWQLSERTVEIGNVYVVGDNRSMPIASHTFGQTSISRVVAGPMFE
jgi:signal peptidase I